MTVLGFDFKHPPSLFELQRDKSAWAHTLNRTGALPSVMLQSSPFIGMRERGAWDAPWG